MGKVYDARGSSRAGFVRPPELPLSRPGSKAADLEGYLFVNVLVCRQRARAHLVRLWWNVSPVYDDTLRQRASAQCLTTRQVMTLARSSKGDRQAGSVRCVGVYRNRMTLGWQPADPTVVYR